MSLISCSPWWHRREILPLNGIWRSCRSWRDNFHHFPSRKLDQQWTSSLDSIAATSYDRNFDNFWSFNQNFGIFSSINWKMLTTFDLINRILTNFSRKPGNFKHFFPNNWKISTWKPKKNKILAIFSSINWKILTTFDLINRILTNFSRKTGNFWLYYQNLIIFSPTTGKFRPDNQNLLKFWPLN